MTLSLNPQECQNWLCPDLRKQWRIGQKRDSSDIVLQATEGSEQYVFSSVEGFALRYFTGKYTVAQIQNLLETEYPDIEPVFVVYLLQKLIQLYILSFENPTSPNTDSSPPNNNASSPTNPFGDEELETDSRTSPVAVQPASQYPQPPPGFRPSPPLKPSVEWRYHPDRYWILRNSEDLNYQMQVNLEDKPIIDELGKEALPAICAKHGIEPEELKQLLQQLAATGMLEGTEPIKPRRGKFNPMQLLYFKLPLFNPDGWLTKTMPFLRFLWSSPITFLLSSSLVFSIVIGLHSKPVLVDIGKQLMETYGRSFLIPFVLLMALVVSLHELGHAFTLKRYGGVVPEMGFLFMCLVPAAYTNTTDSYSLPRNQRVQVIFAGVLVQFLLAALALWLWYLTPKGTWLNIAALLLMAAALVTVALNLNPLAKFDGYYLAVALTGINNLRSLSFKFYGDLIKGKSIPETGRDRMILALYAPLSLLYIWFVFGFLFWRIFVWILGNAPLTVLFLFLIWLIYYNLPDSSKATQKS